MGDRVGVLFRPENAFENPAAFVSFSATLLLYSSLLEVWHGPFSIFGVLGVQSTRGVYTRVQGFRLIAAITTRTYCFIQ